MTTDDSRQAWVVIALYYESYSEDPSDVEGVAIFPDERSAKEFAARMNGEIAARSEAADAASNERSERRRELFGDKWPLSAEESAALGPSQSYYPGCSEFVVVQAVPPASLAGLTEHCEVNNEIRANSPV